MNDSSFHPHANGESSEDTNSERMVENLNQSNQQLLRTIDKLKAGEIQVNINDTGTGLPPTILPKLFTKFVSTDYGGTGLEI